MAFSLTLANKDFKVSFFQKLLWGKRAKGQLSMTSPEETLKTPKYSFEVFDAKKARVFQVMPIQVIKLNSLEQTKIFTTLKNLRKALSAYLREHFLCPSPGIKRWPADV